MFLVFISENLINLHYIYIILFTHVNKIRHMQGGIVDISTLDI